MTIAARCFEIHRLPLLALFEHRAMSELSPLSGPKRKLDLGAVRSAF